MRLLGFLLVFSLSATAAEPHDGDRRSSPLFESTATLSAVLRLPWQAIVTDEFFYQGGYPSLLELTDEQGQLTSIALDTERRGMSRQVICRHPPIKLRFRKEEVKGTLFEGQTSLKLVTHCDRSQASEQYQVLEALAYRMYNQVSDFSFRVRPLSVTYSDSDTGKSDGPRFAFLIESDREVARRNGQKTLNISEVSPERMEAREASKLALFQYMIANAAWSLKSKMNETECCDNLKLIGQDPEKGPVYAIPNDFDASGLVNARYAKPGSNRNKTDGTERVFLGFCDHNSTLNEARDLFLDKQDDLLSLVNNDERLAGDLKQQTVEFLGLFFQDLRQPERFEKQIMASCRN